MTMDSFVIFGIVLIIVAAISVPIITISVMNYNNETYVQEIGEASVNHAKIMYTLVDEEYGTEYLVFWAMNSGYKILPRYYPNGTIVNHYNGEP